MTLKEIRGLKSRLGQRASWNFYGMSEGSLKKKGQGKIVHVEILLFGSLSSGEGSVVRYYIENNKGLTEVPSSCISRFHKKRVK